MSTKYKHEFETASYGRSISDDGWEQIEPEHISIWKSAIETLGTRSLKLPNGVAHLEVDWKPILKKHERHHAAMKRVHGPHKDEKHLRSALRSFPRRKAVVKLTAEIVGGDERAKEHRAHLAAYAIESYLHDFFLILNICAPGSCDFYRGELLGETTNPTEISLSNFCFDVALLGSLKERWPKIKTLSLAQTIDWFYSVRPSSEQLPTNPMEKVLFALLHISKLDMTPMVVIWLFYAFESLLQTKVGENFGSLVQRLTLLLELGENESTVLRKELRSLYDIRSAIVHGGFEITHPMHSEFLDKRVEKNYRRISDAADYGMNALVAAVQATIVRGWRYPNFSEKVHGTPFVNGA